MALGTLASRATGFLRVAALGAALGIERVNDAYNTANTIPNIVYELLLGGILTSVVVPLLVSAGKEDGDDGERFGSALLNLVVAGLTVVVVVAVLAAPLLARAYAGSAGAEERRLVTTFLRYFLPQILFYGVGATISAVLNTRGRFGAPMAAPVLNNLVVIATAITFAMLSRTRGVGVTSMSGSQTAVLAIGTTLGVVIMTVALLPSLRRSGFRWRWRGGFRHPRMRHAARLGAWVLLYVGVNQVAYLVVIRLANQVPGGVTSYQYAFLLFQLPHAIVAVSVVTALLPRMSRHAADDDLPAVRDDVSTGLRLTAAVLVPAALGYAVLARPIAVVVFDHGRTTADQAAQIGQVLSVFALGLVAFSAFQLLLRAYYAQQDSRTPALVNIGVNAVNIAVDLVLFATLDGRTRVIGLAAGYAASYVVGTALLVRGLRRRLGGIDGARVTRLAVRVTVGALLAALAAYGASRIVLRLLGNAVTGSLVATAAGVAVAAPLYFVCARRMRVHEVTDVIGVARARLGR
jgi:putative peptidoglycan lipid II flippase